MFGLVSARARWSVLGAVVVVLVGGGGLLTASAEGSSRASSFVPITPCRLLDTRPSEVVGPRAAPLGPVTTYTATVWGSNGNCTIPASATGVSMNIVAVNPSAASFLTVFPADQTRPLASSLNWVGGQPPTPNAVTVAASAADGKISFYNLAGSVDLAVDIVGYYELSSGGSAGPPGAPGEPGPRPAQVVWVAKSGGHFTTLSAALASITDNSAAKPYLVRIAPGVYTETSVTLLKDYVDIEGSGQTVTTIGCDCGTSLFGLGMATIAAHGGVHTQVRELAITTNGVGQPYAAGIYVSGLGGGQLAIRNVTATAGGGVGNTWAVYNASSSPTMTDVVATATGGSIGIGVYNASSSPAMTNVTATATGGINNYGVHNDLSSSPTMTNVTATATGGMNSRAVFNFDSSPTMTGGMASAREGTEQNTAIYNKGGSPVFNTVTATGTGGTQARGVANENGASATLVNVTAVASGGTSNQNWGIDNSGNATMAVRDSFITGTPNSIVNNAAAAVRVANTVLSTAANGSMACINTYLAATFVALNASCQ